MSVYVVNWNPRRPVLRGRIGRRIPLRRPINNFGDLLGPILVQRLVEDLRLDEPRGPRRLVTVGSILRLARNGDTIWGTGANGKSLTHDFPFDRLDVRAVRGPRTAELLRDRGINVPQVFGDPGLLVGHFWSREKLAEYAPPRSPKTLVIPNFHDFPSMRRERGVLNPTSPVRTVLGAIARADLVVGSSLHGIIVAESLGVSARAVRSGTEPAYKYDDYYGGTDRLDVALARDVGTAIELGGERPPRWDPEPLLNAFPRDLWSARAPHDPAYEEK